MVDNNPVCSASLGAGSEGQTHESEGVPADQGPYDYTFYLMKKFGRFQRQFNDTARELDVQVYRFPKVHGTRYE